MSDVISGNARYWEAIAPHRKGCSLDDIREGRALDPIELDALGDLVGRRCLQVAAAVGDEALQMALLGARVTALDIAPSHLATGRDKAAALGLDVDYRVGDMTRMPPDLKELDVVYISWGGLCWVPDLGAWVQDVSRRLAPGGRLVVAEHHPLWEILSVTAGGDLHVNGSYFEPRWTGDPDADKAPQVLRELAEHPSGETAFVWGVGAVVTAMLDAGLTLTRLTEHPQPEMYAGLRGADAVPAIYLAVGTRPA